MWTTIRLLLPRVIWPQRAKNLSRHLRTRNIEEDWRRGLLRVSELMPPYWILNSAPDWPKKPPPSWIWKTTSCIVFSAPDWLSVIWALITTGLNQAANCFKIINRLIIHEELGTNAISEMASKMETFHSNAFTLKFIFRIYRFGWKVCTERLPIAIQNTSKFAPQSSPFPGTNISENMQMTNPNIWEIECRRKCLGLWLSLIRYWI